MDNFKLDKIKKRMSNKGDKLYDLGVDLSPLLYFYVYEIIKYAISNKINKVYYQTREGETFIKVHRIIEKNKLFGSELPECELLEVSRVATFAPSMKQFSIDEMMRIWSQYKEQSVEDIFKSLNIDIGNYLEFIKKYNIDSKRKINQIWENQSIKMLFNDEIFVSKIENEINKKRADLVEFFKQKGIEFDDKKLFVVDLGWRGTIQDNIALIYRQKKVEGFYYALFEYNNAQPSNTKKVCFIQDKKITQEYISPMVILFEMLFNPESGSVIGYKNGVAVRKVKKEESDVVKNVTSYIQKGMLDGADFICKNVSKSITDEDIREYIYNSIKKIKENPPMELCEAYYSLVHNDTFGTGEYIDKRTKLSFRDKLNIFKCRDLLRKEDWKEAFIKYNNIHVLKVLLKIKGKI